MRTLLACVISTCLMACAGGPAPAEAEPSPDAAAPALPTGATDDRGVDVDGDGAPGAFGTSAEPSYACEPGGKAGLTPRAAIVATSTCDPVAGAPGMSVTVDGSIDKGQGMTFSWSADGFPDDSSIGFFLVRADGAPYGAPGSVGPMMIRAEKICGATRGTTTWDGATFACAPNDAPTLCAGGVEPGDYHIEAVVYEGAAARIERGYSSSPPPKERARTRSARFAIRGDYAVGPLKGQMLGAAVNAVAEFFGVGHWSGTRVDRYVSMDCASFRGPDQPGPAGRYCATFNLEPPLVGKLDACGTVLMWSKVDVAGTPAYRPGVIDYASARAKARIADLPYLDRVESKDTSGVAPPGGGTYLSSTVFNWVYRADGGYWLLEIIESKAGGSESGPDRFADTVLVRVADDGHACVVKTVKYRTPLGVDIFKDAVVCP